MKKGRGAMWEYLPYCDEGSVFYRPGGNPDKSQRLQTTSLPADWQQSSDDVWEHWSPPDVRMPAQGWKIHLSARLADASSTLALVSEICIRERVAFKFLPTEFGLQLSNSKNADRASSGKFITVYPANDTQLELLAFEFDRALSSRPAPYILSDVRFQDGPVFFRYGGFIGIEMRDRMDEIEFVVVKSGILAPDVREPVFSVPEDVSIPGVVQKAINAYESDEPTLLDDYEDLDPLHFSNSGGVYLASHKDHTEPSILKEARPHAGLDLRGRDAVERINVEAEMLTALSDSGLAPRIRRTFKAWEHSYLEMEYLPYPSLRDWTVQNFPFATSTLTEQQRAGFVEKASSVAWSLIHAVKEVHRHGRVLGDIHPDNVMIAEDLTVRFIDLEDGRSLDSMEPSGFNAIGYRAPAKFTAAQADWYAVARVAVSIYHVDFMLELLAEDSWRHLVQSIKEEFGEVAHAPIQEALSEIESAPPAPPSGRPNESVTVYTGFSNIAHDADEFRTALLRGITKTRSNVVGQLYPGDIAQWRESGALDIASGAAGVLHSRLLMMDSSQLTPDVTWLSQAMAMPSARHRAGLFNGAAGIAGVLSASNLHDDAQRVMSYALKAARQKRRSDLYGGLAGQALAALGMGVSLAEKTLEDASQEIAATLEQRLFRKSLPWAVEPLFERAGLFYGWSGVSLLYTALASHTGEHRYAALAEQCLRQDLSRTVVSEVGIRSVEDRVGNRTLPYLAWGSAGVIVAISALRGVAGYDRIFEAEWESLLAACQSRVYAYPGLFNGRAGVIAALAAAQHYSPELRDTIQSQVDLLAEYALTWRDTLQFPGEGYFRLSADYGTGSSGILASLHSITAHPMGWLPVVGSETLFQFVKRDTKKWKESS